ncbi:MAG: sigma 54-interacting transcriptional regulator [Candidatus Brocadiia bacterium]
MAATAILCITQDDELRQAFHAAGRQMEAVVHLSPDLQEAARAVARRPYDLLLVEMAALPRQAREQDGHLFGGLPPVVALGRKKQIRDAVWAVHAGARDYVWMPAIDSRSLRLMLARALRRNGHGKQEWDEAAEQKPPFGDFITVNRELLNACDALRTAADSATPVAIWGESGTGKTTLAREMHRHSVRRLGPFVEVNCTTRAGTDFVNELFGPAAEEGVAGEGGRLLEADGGTLLVKGADNMPAPLLADLLTGAQESTFRRNGRVVESAARLVVTFSSGEARTGGETLTRPAGGAFEIVSISVPPLHRRPADIPLLANHFLRVFSADRGTPVPEVTSDALGALLRYRWPGNVRELRNCIEHSVLLADQGRVGLTELPHCVVEHQDHAAVMHEAPEPGPLREALRGPERRYILRALQSAGGNKRDAARRLQISRSTLYKKLREHGLDDEVIRRRSET